MSQPQQLIIPKSAEFFGFSANETGGHMGRSMMLRELELLVRVLPVDAETSDYKSAVLSDNVLGKPTFSSREESIKRLLQLYGLDPSKALFRVLRKLATYDPNSLPLIAATCVFCRDEQLRHSFLLIDQLKVGEVLEPSRMQDHLELGYPGRFSAAMKASMARNVTASWTFSGHLHGSREKKRSIPTPRPAASTYAMMAGYLLGLRGQVLLGSVYGRLVAPNPSIIIPHLELAARMNWLRLRHGGGVLEIDYSPILTVREQGKINESH